MIVMQFSPEVPRHDGSDKGLLSKLTDLVRPLIAEQPDRLRHSDGDVRVSVDNFTQSKAEQLARDPIALSALSKRSFHICVELDEQRKDKLIENWPQLTGSDGYMVTVRPTEAVTVQGFLRMFADAP
jgi:hypothetical protein